MVYRCNGVTPPQELDMSSHLASGRPALYSLTGVLMHVGPDANHGHYIAHIQVRGLGCCLTLGVLRFAM